MRSLSKTDDFNTYIVEVAGLPAPIVATYRAGILDELRGLAAIAEQKPLDIRIKQLPIAWREANIEQVTDLFNGKVTYTLKGKDTQQKIILWYNCYKQTYGMAYKISQADAKKLEKVVLTESLLRLYFDQPDKYPYTPKTVENYCRTINELCRLQEGKVSTAPKMPNVWDRAYYQTLDIHQCAEYCKHLKALGYEKQLTETGFLYLKK